MSGYRYYEFQAIDHPLDHEAQAALRKISPRATITAHSFSNSYEWGEFRGEPAQLMERWFDLFIYWSNWGARTLMLRLPRRYLDLEDARPYAIEEIVETWTAGDFTLVSFNSDPEEPYLEDESDLATALRSLRADLLRGDRRVLYLGWLLGVQSGWIDDDSRGPPRPPGLGSLPEPLEVFAQFLGLDQDLLTAAAQDDAGAAAAIAEPSRQQLAAFIEALPEAEKASLLQRAVLDNDPHIRLDLSQRWAAAQGVPPATTTPGAPPRTARDLRMAAEACAEARRQRAAKREAAEQARREEQALRELEARLDSLKPRVEAAWHDVEALVKTKVPKNYDRALEQLKTWRGWPTGRAMARRSASGLTHSGAGMPRNQACWRASTMQDCAYRLLLSP